MSTQFIRNLITIKTHLDNTNTYNSHPLYYRNIDLHIENVEFITDHLKRKKKTLKYNKEIINKLLNQHNKLSKTRRYVYKRLIKLNKYKRKINYRLKNIKELRREIISLQKDLNIYKYRYGYIKYRKNEGRLYLYFLHYSNFLLYIVLHYLSFIKGIKV